MSDLFDPTTVEDSAYPVLQPGTYRALVEHCEIKPTKAGTGRYVQVNLSTLDQPMKGHKIRAFLNFENQNATAQNIGRAQLKKFLASFGVTTAVDLQTIGLLAKNKVVTVEVEIEDGQSGPQNRVVNFLAPQAQASKAQGQRLDPNAVPF